jgi:glycyl-tRNA synthetase beta chain
VLALAQADTEEELTGPSWKIAFPNGEAGPRLRPLPRRPALKFRRSKNHQRQGRVCRRDGEAQGRAAAELLAAELPKEVLWHLLGQEYVLARGKPERFVRPVRWLSRCSIRPLFRWRLPASRQEMQSRGHRILHGERRSRLLHRLASI